MTNYVDDAMGALKPWSHRIGGVIKTRPQLLATILRIAVAATETQHTSLAIVANGSHMLFFYSGTEPTDAQ